jgi:hypothetical protein
MNKKMLKRKEKSKMEEETRRSFSRKSFAPRKTIPH